MPSAYANYYVLARLYLDTGTEYLSDAEVSHPTRTYDGRVLQWGLIDRSIPVPAGIPQVSDCRIRVDDSDRKWRDLSVSGALRRRYVDLKLVAHGASESAAGTFFRGEIADYNFGPAYIELNIKNRAFGWLDEEIPAFINEQNYGEGVQRAFLNIIQGHCVTTIVDQPGAIPCPHIKFDLVAGDRFGLAAHPCEEVLEVYRKIPTKAVPADPEWMLVDPIEYTIGTEVDRTFVEVPGIPFNPAYIDFAVEQEPGTLIRANVDGINYRGPWEGIPEVIGFEEARHPINYFINMMYLVMHKAGTDSSVWEVSSIENLLGVFESFVPDSAASSGFTRHKCDGAITEVITVREWLGRFCQSTQIQVLELVNGKLAVAYIGDTDPSRPVFKEGYHFIKDSFLERAAQPTVNQIRYHYKRHHGTGQFENNDIFDNLDDQLALGAPILDSSSGEPTLDSSGNTIIQPHIEADDVDLWFVRDPVTALFIIGRRMNYLALGSLRQEWKMPLPEVMGNVELAKLVGLTHSMGAAVIGGYVNTEVAITNVTLDLKSLMVTVRSILRVPVAIVPNSITASVPIELLEGEIEPDSESTTAWKGTQSAIDPADYEGRTEAKYENTFERDTDVDDHSYKLVDSVPAEYAANVFAAGPSNNFQSRQESVFTLNPVARTYYFQNLICATPGCHINQARIWIDVEGSNRLAIRIPMIFGGQQIGGWSGSEDFNNGNFHAAECTSATSYAQQASMVNNYGIFKKEAGKWGTPTAWKLIANAYNQGYTGADFGRIAFFNRTKNLMIPGTEMEWLTADTRPNTPRVVTISHTTTNFDDDDEFEFRSLNSSGSSLRKLCINRAELVPIVTKKPCQIYIKVGSKAQTQPGNFITKLEVSKFDAGTVWYFEAVAAILSGTSKMQLRDLGTTDETDGDVADPGTLVHEFTYTGSKERKRAAFTPENNHRYVLKFVNVRACSAFIIAEIPE